MPPPHQSVSKKQLADNRAIAAKSTGPRTPQGKARAAQNGHKHAFTASTFAVVRLESGLFTTCLNESLDPTGNPVILTTEELAGTGEFEITPAQNRNYLLKAQSPKTKNTKRTHFRPPTRTKGNHLSP